MPLKTTAEEDPNRKAAVDDIRHILGHLEDRTLIEVLATSPTLHDLTLAALWRRGDGDLIAREHRELSPSAAAIIEILSGEEEEQEADDRL